MLDKVIDEAIAHKASDIHLTNNLFPVLRIDGNLHRLNKFATLNPQMLKNMTKQLLGGNYETYKKLKSFDTAVDRSEYRFRVHVFQQQEADAIVLRLIPKQIPKIEDLGLPKIIQEFTKLNHGLVLVTGITGSGKSTTLAALINKINQEQHKHIITVEDPVEFIYQHDKSMINQREVGSDVLSFADAVRAAVREDPDIVLVGEMRDLETIENTITIAETGHLVFATLHTQNTAETINRIVDVFPANQQQQIRLQISSVLQGIVSQVLLPKEGGGRIPACEVLVVTDSIRSLIREASPSATFEDQIQMNYRKLGSQTFQQSLALLYNQGFISYETATKHSSDTEVLQHMIERLA